MKEVYTLWITSDYERVPFEDFERYIYSNERVKEFYSEETTDYVYVYFGGLENITHCVLYDYSEVYNALGRKHSRQRIQDIMHEIITDEIWEDYNAGFNTAEGEIVSNRYGIILSVDDNYLN